MISEVSRKNIIDALCVEKVKWNGQLEEIQFLSRIFDLEKLPSNDGRFSSASGDIWQHRVNNYDWDDDWIYSDSRFGLLRGPDDNFIRFICEMVHPLVRPEPEEVSHLIALFNRYLASDGLEVAENDHVSGIPLYAVRQRIVGSNYPISTAKAAITLNADYIEKQIARMQASIETDPELAIGTAKEFVETICKTILSELGENYHEDEKVQNLLRMTLKKLQLVPDEIHEAGKAAYTTKTLLSNLASIAINLTELRNPYGTGHGKAAYSKGLGIRHARLAVGASSTLAVFLFETYKEMREI